MKNKILKFAFAIAIAANIGLPANINAQSVKATIASQWVVKSEKSGISWTTNWAGQAVSGMFAIDARTSSIVFDPNNLGASNVVINVPINSLNSASKEAKENLPMGDWFGLKKFPNATFTANNFKAIGNGRYLATGFLIIKGVRYNLPLNFGLQIRNNIATMDAATTLDRINLKIGTDSDPKAEWVDRNVKVNIKLVAQKK